MVGDDAEREHGEAEHEHEREQEDGDAGHAEQYTAWGGGVRWSGDPRLVSHPIKKCYTAVTMPTTRPRYTITDTGSTRALLDAAQRRWPEIEDRKELLLRLAQTGHDSLHLDEAEAQAHRLRKRQSVALKRMATLVDSDILLSDRAWE